MYVASVWRKFGLITRTGFKYKQCFEAWVIDHSHDQKFFIDPRGFVKFHPSHAHISPLDGATAPQ